MSISVFAIGVWDSCKTSSALFDGIGIQPFEIAFDISTATPVDASRCIACVQRH
jgi:hypothetical protein